MKAVNYLMIALVVLVLACIEKPVEPDTIDTPPIVTEPIKSCPDSCDDGDPCTDDTCTPETLYECTHSKKTDCCGNNDCERFEDHINCPADCEGPEIDPKIAEFKQTAEERIKDFKFLYYNTEYTETHEYWIKDNLVKINLASTRRHDDKGYDIAYLDLGAQTATGYCTTAGSCNQEDTVLLPNNIYTELYPVTPKDKLDEIDNGALTGSKEIIDGKECAIIMYENADGKTEKAWIWEYNGLPLRYSLLNSNEEVVKTVEWRQLVISTLKEVDVTLPDV